MNDDNILVILENIYQLKEKISKIYKDPNNIKIIQNFEILMDDNSNHIHHNIIKLLLKIIYISTKKSEPNDIIHKKLEEITNKLKEYINIQKIILKKFIHSNDCREYLICKKILYDYEKGREIEYYSSYVDVVLKKHFYNDVIDYNDYHKISLIISDIKEEYDNIINQIQVLTKNQYNKDYLILEISQLLIILNTKKTKLEESIDFYLKKFEGFTFKIGIRELNVKLNPSDYDIIYELKYKLDDISILSSKNNINVFFDKIWTFIKNETCITDESHNPSDYTISYFITDYKKTDTIINLFINNLNNYPLVIVKIL